MIETAGPTSRNEDELVLRTNYRISHPERLANGNSRSQLVIVGCICVPLSLLITSSIYPVISLFRCCVELLSCVEALSFEVLVSSS